MIGNLEGSTEENYFYNLDINYKSLNQLYLNNINQKIFLLKNE